MSNISSAEIISAISVIISLFTLLATFFYQRNDLKHRQQRLQLEWAEFKEKYETPESKLREWLRFLPTVKEIRDINCVKYSGTPFRVGVPVSDDDTFFGRSDILNRLLENARAKQMLSFSVLGSRRSGKTSLLRRLANILTTEEYPNVVPVYLDGQIPYTSPEAFYAYMLREAALCLSKRCLGMANVPDMPLEAPFSRLEEFLETTNRAKIRFLFLLDEFEALSEGSSSDERLFGSLRATIQIGDVAWVTASQNSVYQPGSESSPFGNILLSSLYVGALDLEDAVKLIMQPSARAGYPFDDKDAAFLLDLAGRMPYLLQMASQILYGKRSDKFKEEDIYEQVRKDFLCNTQVLFKSLLDNLKIEELNTLIALAKHENIDYTEAVLYRLVAFGFIEKKEDVYHILGQGFKDYLKNWSTHISINT